MPPVYGQVTCPVLIGRVAQLEAILQLAQQAQAGHGHIGLITGEAGIGKSRLLNEAKRRLLAANSFVLEGRCFETDQTLPYAPVVDMLHRLFAMISPDRFLEELGPAFGEIFKLLPELVALLPNVTPVLVADAQQEKRRLHQAITQLLSHLAASQPLVLVLEDVHWSDEASLELLAYAARYIESQSIFILLTYRSDEIHDGLKQFLATIDRHRISSEWTLSRLTYPQTEAMLQAIFDQEHHLPKTFSQTLYDLTEGNPFFVEEVLKALVSTGDIFIKDNQWVQKSLEELNPPRTVQIAVRQRTDKLSANARDLLVLASVTGRRFDFDLLQHLTQYSESKLAQLFEELIQQQLVIEESADTLTFRHALTQQAVYANLSARERRKLHLRIAEAIESLYQETDPHLENLSHHFYKAEAWAKAAAYAQGAGQKAMKFYSPQATQEQYSRALSALQQLPESLSSNLYTMRAQVREQLGNFEGARDDYEQALHIAASTQNQRGQWENLLHLGFLWTGRDFERAGGYLQRAVEISRLTNDPAALAHSLNRVGNWYANQEQPSRALQYHQEALAIFQASGERRAITATFDLLGVTTLMAGDMIASADYYKQAVQHFRELDDLMGLSSSLANFAMRGGSYMAETTACPIVTLETCRQDGEEAIKIAQKIGWQSGEAGAAMYVGLALGSRGDYERAFKLGEMALTVASQIEHRLWITGAHMLLGRLYLDVLDLSTAQQHLESGLSLAKESRSKFLIGAVSGFLASTYIRQSKLSGAEMVLRMALSGEASLESPQTMVQRILTYAYVESLLASSRAVEALDIIDRMIETGRTSSEPLHIAPHLLYLRGEILLSLNRFSEVEKMLSTAQSAALAQQLTPVLWRIQANLGQIYLRNGQRSKAAAALDAALETVEQLAEKLPTSLLRANFVQHAQKQIPQLSKPSPQQTMKQIFDGLTEREREISVLIAQGKSSREIADELVLSKRTVDAHIGNILTKLNFSSRAQIARWSVEKGLV